MILKSAKVRYQNEGTSLLCARNVMSIKIKDLQGLQEVFRFTK